MRSNERAILRIRCSRELFRKFKKIAVDYDSYEGALEKMVEYHEKYLHFLSPSDVQKKAVGYTPTVRRA